MRNPWKGKAVVHEAVQPPVHRLRIDRIKPWARGRGWGRLGQDRSSGKESHTLPKR